MTLLGNEYFTVADVMQMPLVLENGKLTGRDSRKLDLGPLQIVVPVAVHGSLSDPNGVAVLFKSLGDLLILVRVLHDAPKRPVVSLIDAARLGKQHPKDLILRSATLPAVDKAFAPAVVKRFEINGKSWQEAT